MAIFTEDPTRTLLHRCRVWISGIEVTSRLTSSPQIGIVGRRGHNTAAFTLSNAGDGFILNQGNIGGSWNTGDAEYGEHSEVIKFALYQYKNNEEVNPVDIETEDRRWPLNAGSLVIHALDTVFIAARWPYTSEELWIPIFKGYIDSKPLSDDAITGKSTISISCMDIRGIMEKMRVQVNALVTTESFVVSAAGTGIGNESAKLNAFDPVLRDSLFADLQLPTNLSNSLAELTLEETLRLLITGLSISKATVTDGDDGITTPGYLSQLASMVAAGAQPAGVTETATTIEIRGIGRFRNDLDVVRWPTHGTTSDSLQTGDIQVLEEWHRLCLFGLTNIGEPWTEEQLLEHGAECNWDGDTAPHAMQLLMLLPSTESGMRGVTDYTIDSGSSTRQWLSRLTIIEDYLEKLDYHWFVSPSGDIVVEFPMYDFLPEHFGEWAEAFTFKIDGELKFTSLEDDRPMVPAVVQGTGRWSPDGTLFEPAVFDGDGASLTNTRTTLYSPMIAARFGMEVERVSFPYVTDVCRLRQFTVLHFQRRLADASIISVDYVFRPLILPNRPVLVERRNRMGWVSSVNLTVSAIKEHGIPATSISLKYARRIDTDGKYRLLTGSRTLPLSYTGAGPLILPERGIFITENIQLGQEVMCSGDTTGQPVGNIQAVTIAELLAASEASSDCLTDENRLSATAKTAWRALQALALSRYSLTLELICTHNSGSPHESLSPYAHGSDPSSAFDIKVTKGDGSSGGAEDYAAVGSLASETGLVWGGDGSSTATTIQTIQSKIISRCNFHVNKQTPYVWGGYYDRAHGYGVDCAGLIEDCYSHAGVIPNPGNESVGTLFNKYRTPSDGKAKAGMLAFYRQSGSSSPATHVTIVAQDGSSVYSASGNSKHTTVEKARADGAQVKYKTQPYWTDGFVRFGDPYAELAAVGKGYVNHFSVT